MNNKEFIDGVYKKYEYYKNVKDEFFDKSQYKKNNKSIYKVASILIILFLTTGMVYAASYYIRNIWEEPEEYIYIDEKQIKEEDVINSITEEEAKNVALKYFNNLDINIDEIKRAYLNKEPSTNKIEWVLESNNNIEIRINAENGELYSFSNNNLLNIASDSVLSENEAIEIAKELYNKLSYKDNYEFCYISNLGIGKWQADFCVKYNEIFNPYQCIRITFIAETKEIVMLNVFDYEFENNNYEITQEQAINIVKNKYNENKFNIISVKEDIQKLNSILYQKDESVLEGEYRVNNIVRNVWNVEVKEKETGFVEKVFVDATTGEIIGGDQIK